jgi:hypothetical protein
MSQPNAANSLFTVHVANQLDVQEQINNSWHYLEVPDVTQYVDEVCEVSGSGTVITNDEDWYVENLSMKVGTSKLCDSIPHEVKDFHSIEKGFDSSPDFREIHCEFKDVSNMSQVDGHHNTKSKSTNTSTDVKIVSDVPTKTPSVTPPNDINIVDSAIQCDLDKGVSKDSITCANNMHLLSDPKVVLSGLRSESCKEKSSTTTRVSDIQQPVVRATHQNVSSKIRSANKTHRGMSSIDIMCFILRLFFVLFAYSCMKMKFSPESDYNVQGSQKDVYNLSVILFLFILSIGNSSLHIHYILVDCGKLKLRI